jgi:hypothetical protein
VISAFRAAAIRFMRLANVAGGFEIYASSIYLSPTGEPGTDGQAGGMFWSLAPKGRP